MMDEDLIYQPFTWVASDRTEHVAAFEFGLQAPIPVELTEWSADDVFGIWDALLTLPKVCHAGYYATALGDYLAFAERGIYTFDSSRLRRPMFALGPKRLTPTGREPNSNYFHLAWPERPIMVHDLPESLACFAKRIVFTDISFSDIYGVDIRRHFQCLEG